MEREERTTEVEDREGETVEENERIEELDGEELKKVAGGSSVKPWSLGGGITE